jgi:Ca-activated chloride channel family protein
VWAWRRGGQEVVVPFDHGRVAPAGRAWRGLLALAESLPALLLAVAIVLLAGPLGEGKPGEKRLVTNIELCVDVSGSMRDRFGAGTRYDGAMKAVEEFLDYRKGDAVGLTFFGNNVLHWVPLTTDPSAIKYAPPFMRPEVAPRWFGGTDIARALRACLHVLVERQDGGRMIVLISDGEDTNLTARAAEALARELQGANVSVFVILVGPTRIQRELYTITETTGGAAFLAGDPEALHAVFRQVDHLKQAPLERTRGESRDDFGPWCLAGLVLLGLSGLAGLGVRYTPW